MRIYVFAATVIQSLFALSQAPMAPCNCPDVNYIFVIEEGSHYGISDQYNCLVLPPVYERVLIERYLRDSCFVPLDRVILRENGREYTVDLKTNNRTPDYDYMAFVHSCVVGVDSTGWYVFDKNLNIVGDLIPGVPCHYNTAYNMYVKLNSFARTRYLEDQDYLWRLVDEKYLAELTKFQVDTSIFTYVVTPDSDKKVKTIGVENPEYYGLINVGTGKRTKPKYLVIYEVYDDTNKYYWAFDFDSLRNVFEEKPDQRSYYLYSGKLEVFSADMKKKSSIPFKNPEYNAGHSFGSGQFIPAPDFSNPLTIFCGMNGMMGVINRSGEIIIPFEYDDITYHYDTAMNYKIWNNGKAHLVDDTGNNKLEKAYYDIFNHHGTNKFIVKTDSTPNSICLIDKQENILVENCSSIRYTSNFSWERNSYFNNHPKRQTEMLGTPEFIIVKNNLYYLFINDTLVKVDTNNFEFDYPIDKIENSHIVNQNGEIIITAKYINQKTTDITAEYFLQPIQHLYFRLMGQK
ncbi:MAG: WG repeat-containing protein [Crocinitomicaceae bacterium]|nr:WG repeat-containing protein [Crocinitomicaceae bacterium]